MKKLFLLVVALMGVFLAGCNTMAGFGKDAQAAGQAIEGAAKK